MVFLWHVALGDEINGSREIEYKEWMVSNLERADPRTCI